MRVINLSELPACIDDICQWHFDEWGKFYPEKTIKDFRRELEESFNDPNIPSTWLLIESGDVLGTASILEHDMTTNKLLSPWLANVFIHPDRRGEGLGETSNHMGNEQS